MLLIQNATNDWTKFSFFFFFYQHYIGESAELFKKNSVMQYARETWRNPICTVYACYNARVSYSIRFLTKYAYSWQSFLANNFANSIVRVKIKILFSRWVRLELATSAITWWFFKWNKNYYFEKNRTMHLWIKQFCL